MLKMQQVRLQHLERGTNRTIQGRNYKRSQLNRQELYEAFLKRAEEKA